MFHPFLFGGTMNWYVVDKEYVKHLSQSDSRVGYVEYGDKLKLHGCRFNVLEELCNNY